MAANSKYTDLIKTIDDDEEVEDFSEASDIEVEVSLRLCLFTTKNSHFFNFPP